MAAQGPGLGGQMGPGQMPVSVLSGMHPQQGGMMPQGAGGMIPQGGMVSQQVGMLSQSGMVPVQQQANPQVQPSSIGPVAGQPQQPVVEIDPIAKFKSLLPRLKESLVNLFKTGGHLFYQNATQDETGVQYEHVSGRFDKSLEEFYAICDQIEICLRLAYEILQQDRDSARNTPNPVLPQKTDAPQPEGQLYSHYLSTVRAQISCAKDIRDLLHECLKNFPEHSHP
ncbi:unnamed protein product [Candidula unifasciata]|uniref:Mediator of RNA polymerase II transcription subunit 29 n=1 Tax=Candidula unifasciata TaxID=100452 RepID=A0A8S4A2N6_9EUPU|nr:unnamed protein product [Candidula unifasciata]